MGNIVGSPLSPRQKEIIGYTLDGYKQYEIAEKLLIGPRTLKTHLSLIREKLGARTTYQAIAKYCKEGGDGE